MSCIFNNYYSDYRSFSSPMQRNKGNQSCESTQTTASSRHRTMTVTVRTKPSAPGPAPPRPGIPGRTGSWRSQRRCQSLPSQAAHGDRGTHPMRPGPPVGPGSTRTHGDRKPRAGTRCGTRGVGTPARLRLPPRPPAAGKGPGGRNAAGGRPAAGGELDPVTEGALKSAPPAPRESSPVAPPATLPQAESR